MPAGSGIDGRTAFFEAVSGGDTQRKLLVSTGNISKPLVSPSTPTGSVSKATGSGVTPRSPRAANSPTPRTLTLKTMVNAASARLSSPRSPEKRSSPSPQGKSTIVRGKASPASVAAFSDFAGALAVDDTNRAFLELLSSVGVEPPGSSPSSSQSLGILRSLCGARERLPQRLAALVAALEKRAAMPQYDGGEGGAGLRASILGAGPVGLRCAVELALLGWQVSVLEGRVGWSRLNVLHLWSWVEADLGELGVKQLDPTIFASAQFTHCATRQLQSLLHKVCLLLGVHVKFNCQVGTLDERFKTTLHRITRDARTADADTEDELPCDLLVDATGARCPLFADLGFHQVTMLKGARALGLVCHLRIMGEAWESRLAEGNWAHQFHQKRFTRLSREAGVALQNLVYYQQPGSSHYFVMTAELDALVAHGALHSRDAEDLVGALNVDAGKLEAFARAAIGEFVPELRDAPLLPKQLQIFDFSERRQSNAAALVLPAARFGGPEHKRLMCTRVGDALQEPFWPEGLGINRGFLHVLDCADLARGMQSVGRRRRAATTSTGGAPAVAASAAAASAAAAADTTGPPAAAEHFDYDAQLARLVARREELYGCSKRLSGNTMKTELKPCVDAKRGGLTYRIDPASRYTHLPPRGEWAARRTLAEETAEEQFEEETRAHAAAEAAQREAAVVAAEAERERRERLAADLYHRELVAWTEALGRTQAELMEAEGAHAALVAEAGAQVRAAESAAARAAEWSARRGEIHSRVDDHVDALVATMGQLSLTVSDLEGAKRAAEGGGGGLSAAKASKLDQAQRRLAEANEQKATLLAERNQCDEEGAAAEVAAAHAHAAEAAARAKVAPVEARRAALAAQLGELLQREPRQPAHMASSDELTA